jgi:hypothetical protein
MPGNIAPIYSKVAHWSWPATLVTAANTALDGTGTSYLAFTADGTNGGYVKKLRVKHAGVNVSATVLRVFINNGSTPSTAANNILFDELSIGSNGALSQAASAALYELPINEALPPGYSIYVTIGTACAGGLAVSVVAGKY